MANDYYTVSRDFVPATKVRSGDMDAELAAIEVGFDRLVGKDALSTGSIVHGDETGAADAYVVDNGGTDTFLVGQQATFLPLVTNTGAGTLTLNLGVAKAIIRNDGTALQPGDLIAGVPVMTIYDGTNWVLVGATTQQTKEFLRPAINNQSGTTYTMTSLDESKIILYDSATAVTVTMPANDDDPIPIGHVAHHYQSGVGPVTLSPAAGVTLNYPTGRVTRAQNSSLSTIKVGINTYNVVGDQA